MDDPLAVDRREFLKIGASAAAAAAVACGGPGARWRTLTEPEANTLAAVCARIVPTDEDAGAAEADVVSFIDRQLATTQSDRRPIYKAGLLALDATARRKHKAAFHELSPEIATALLKEVEAGHVDPSDWVGVEPVRFFALLVDHSMMGFYGDPRHGGNRDRVSWRMLGLPDPPVRGQLHEG